MKSETPSPCGALSQKLLTTNTDRQPQTLLDVFISNAQNVDLNIRGYQVFLKIEDCANGENDKDVYDDKDIEQMFTMTRIQSRPTCRGQVPANDISNELPDAWGACPP